MTQRALLELVTPAEPQISPDGKRIAFSVTSTDFDENRAFSSLYVQRRGAKAGRDEPRQLTHGKWEESWPRWCPHSGAWLSFLTNRLPEGEPESEDEDTKRQVWRLPMDGLGGEAEAWTNSSTGVTAYEWLPDGSGIVYLAREPRPKPLENRYQGRIEEEDDAVIEDEEKFRMQIWSIAVNQKKPVLLYGGDLGIGELAIRPDGNTVAYTSNHTGEQNDYHKSDLFTLDLKSGRVRQLTDSPGGKFHPRWSPDGKRLLYLAGQDPGYSYSQPNLFTIAAKGGSPVCVTDALPYDITGWPGFQWTSDGTVYIQAAVGTETHLFRQEGKQWKQITDGPIHVSWFHVCDRDQSIAATISSATEPTELLFNGKLLTDLNGKWSERYKPAPMEVVSWQSTDGRSIEGLLVRPSTGAAPYPMVIHLHGGPVGRSIQKLTPFTQSQVFAAGGYAVFLPNFRGSEGYGNDFSMASQNDLGGADLEDVLSGLDSLIALGIANPNRCGIIGASYGGYLTNLAIGKTDRFQAAVSQFGIFSLSSDFSNSVAPRWEQEYLGGPYWEQWDRYVDRSPMHYVQSMTTPILIMHGENDENTSYSNSREMYTALKLLGRTARFVHYPREGHGFSEPKHVLDETRRIVHWFDQYLGAEPKKTPAVIGTWVSGESGWELLVSSARTEVEYIGTQPPKGFRFVEMVIVLRDRAEARSTYTLNSGNMRIDGGSQSFSAVGFPVDAMGETVLVQCQEWSVPLAAPVDDENVRGVTAPFAATFLVPNAARVLSFALTGIPPVKFELPAPDDEQDETR